MFVYIRSPAVVIVVKQKLVLQQSKNVTAKCTETLSPSPSIQYLLEYDTIPWRIFCTVHLFSNTYTVNIFGYSHRIKDVIQGKLFHKCTHLLYCSVLSLGSNVNTRRMLQPDMGSFFQIKISMKYSGQRKLSCESSKLSNLMLLTS